MATDLGSRLDQGITLPFDWFSDPGIYRLEQRRVFADSWLYAGVADWVAEPGQFFTCRAGLVPVVVVRDEDMRLNAFVNICRHRATEVAQGRGKRMTLQCPYHAWTYGLNGCLRHAPRSEREEGFDPDDYGLLPVGVETWGPFVFVNRNRDAPPLETYLGRMPQILADAGIDFSRLRFHDRSEWEVAANWKAVVENYLECYHCPTAHPDFSKVIDVDPDSYNLTSDEWFSSQISHTREGVRAPRPALQPGRRDRRGALPLAVADVHDQRLPRQAEPRRAVLPARWPRPDDDRHRPLLRARTCPRRRSPRSRSSGARSDARTRGWSSRSSGPRNRAG